MGSGPWLFSVARRGGSFCPGVRQWTEFEGVTVASRRYVVVVDNDSRVSEALESLLDAAQVEARFFESAEDFLALQEPDEVLCLVTDVKMAGMSGYELQRHLVSAELRIPTIFITAHPVGRQSTEAMKLGAIAFLEKPFDGEELLEWLDKVKSAAD
jgi:FixJ family two-component response regulator